MVARFRYKQYLPIAQPTTAMQPTSIYFWAIGVESAEPAKSGGRSKVRTVLYASMWSTIQYDHEIKATYERLLAAGKPKKVALVACMRKQLTILNTILKNGTHWNEKLA